MNVLPQAIAIGNNPERHHHREIERRDAGAHPDRLAQRVRVDLRADVLGVLALEQMRDAAGELDHLDAALHRAHRIGQRLAVLLGHYAGKILLVSLQQLKKLLHDASPPQRRRVAPRR
jgi:hypothetical protein